ncbi:MAG: phosphohistidine phosphatase [Rhizobiales bacterium 62-47]|nr:histidine phosphatase family protein [Hyphomicrobiales bacterium]OJY09552.1 MAG: phosphohistidine phosphatase [Rhizobiales bacterium 62-47]
MRRLMLLRHAKTESDAPSGEDIDRRLDQRGHADAAEMGNWMAEHNHAADLVLVSTAVRARQTWDIVGPLLAPIMRHASVAYRPELYIADPTDLLRIIHGAAAHDPRSLLLIGHNPGLHELALGLSGHGNAATRRALGGNLPTSGLVGIDFDINDWRDVSFQRGRLAFFVTPKLLPKSPHST